MSGKFIAVYIIGMFLVGVVLGLASNSGGK